MRSVYFESPLAELRTDRLTVSQRTRQESQAEGFASSKIPLKAWSCERIRLS